ncbi:enhanced serine sensitivity protein SseB [Streptomyces thermolineatus]|uniref:Enhanced serine sensitivity protein SseB n=1 Tax=Streptomyces thermolineatus TaxID=44033 RepID=A0ABN3KW10_9ACTN
MGIPAQRDGTEQPVGTVPAAHVPWPVNELEEVLTAALGEAGAVPRLVEVLARSYVWVPLPAGGGPDSRDLDLPTLELGGAPYVPVFSSEGQFHAVCPGMSFAVAPMREFARGLPPQLGVAVNPGGSVGIPLPPAVVLDLCRGFAGDPGPDGGPVVHEPGARRTGARVRLWEPGSYEEPVDFLAAAAGELAVTPVVLSARRALASVEAGDPVLFVGVELDRWQEQDRAAALDALGRALGAVPLPWPVNIVLLDIAQDPVGDWMLDRVEPFYSRP